MKSKRNNRGFSLVELLTIVSVLAILSIMALLPYAKGFFQKARDSRRKQDLNRLTRMFEDYYNTYQHYPPSDTNNPGQMQDAHFGSSFPPYAELLPNDPLYPSQNYYYDTDPTNQSFYVLYTRLENTGDPDIELVGCLQGCGPNRLYNYVVASTNLVMIAGVPSQRSDGGAGDLGGGGDGGGGGGTPIPTSGPSPTAGPIPTTPPTPTVIPTAGFGYCSHNQCCYANWCGAGPGVGTYCTSHERCWYDIMYGWGCAYDPSC